MSVVQSEVRRATQQPLRGPSIEERCLDRAEYKCLLEQLPARRFPPIESDLIDTEAFSGRDISREDTEVECLALCVDNKLLWYQSLSLVQSFWRIRLL